MERVRLEPRGRAAAGSDGGVTMRRVLIVTTAFPPATRAGIHRIVRFVRYLPEQGWEPSILSEGTSDGLSGELAAALSLRATRRCTRRYSRS